jgi:hypothetical protein
VRTNSVRIRRCVGVSRIRRADQAAVRTRPLEGTQSTHVEEVVTGHARLAGHASGDDDDLGALERLLEAIVLRAIADALRAKASCQ